MAETDILKHKKSQKVTYFDEEENNFRLPKIQHPKSRGNLQSKAEMRKDTPPLLPNIKHNIFNPAHNNQEKPEEKLNEPSQDPERDDFALQIQERLRMVLQNVNQGEQAQEQNDEEEDLDFQEIIQQNKQKIKQQKQLKYQTNTNLIEKVVKNDKKQNKTKSKTLKNKYQNSIYEKRMKEYRDVTNENKFIQKKKELFLEKQQKQETIDRGDKGIILSKGKDDANMGNYHSGAKIIQNQVNKDKKQGPFRPKFSAKSAKQEDIQRIHYENAKSANLFDNIHNFLENPKKNKIPLEIGKFSRNNIKNLEDQIKQINDKLGVMQNIQNQLNTNIQQKTVLDWKRLQYNRGSNFRCHYDSNFEKQVDRIGSLQQKNSKYLTRLIDHQKTLVELSLIKKSIKLKSENKQQS